MGHEQPDGRVGLGTEGLWCDADTIFHGVFGIIDNGPESLYPMWPVIVKIEFPQSDWHQMVGFRP